MGVGKVEERLENFTRVEDNYSESLETTFLLIYARNEFSSFSRNLQFSHILYFLLLEEKVKVKFLGELKF